MNMPTVSDLITPEAVFKPETVIKLENVSVRYRVPRERVSGIKEYTIQWLKRRLRYEEFWALNDVSLDVARGEVFGVIGRNGSGKSTLLKVIARVLVPTRGRVVLHGRVAPLLELGAGFHNELTGRENIFLNSALLGRSHKEVELLLPEIIDFAEIDDFIDAPLRTYSTGMVARLGFAVATCVRPQILLVDEILSVGDAKFQRKCMDRMYSFQAQGSTVIIVSHSMATIDSFCTRALWLKGGHTKAMGSVSEVISRYVKDLEGGERITAPSKEGAAVISKPTAFLGQYKPLAEINKVYPAEEYFNLSGGTLSVWVKFDSRREYRDAIIFHTGDSRFVLYAGSYYSEELGQDIRVIIARAGGNRRVIDSFYGASSFPEVSASLNQDLDVLGIRFQEDQWQHVCMTWEGWPEGKLVLYINGILIGERDYDRRFDNGRPLAKSFAVGMRPPEWEGEIVQNEDGTFTDVRPGSSLSVSDGNIDIQDVKLYQAALDHEEVQALAVKRVAA
jgi:ABC-type polysaccharide/polyol phosphate transport system ATPase subunit